MRIPQAFLMLFLFATAALADGALVIQPQLNGSLRIFSEGGAERPILTQPAGKALTLQILPAAAGQCDGGDLVAATLRLTLLRRDTQQRLICGETLWIGAGPQSRQIGLEIKSAAQPADYAALLRQGYGPHPQVGSINVYAEDEGSLLWPLLLDLSVLQQEMPVVTAAFDRPTLQFGLVGEQQDARAAVRLRISKTRQAGAEILPYRLSFESAQQQDGRYRLRSSRQEAFIPYSIHVGGQEIAPEGAWHGYIPAGIAASDVVNIEFTLAGRSIRGIAAGSRLLDTLTAVITPDI